MALTNKDTSGKIAYMYDQETNKWYAITGAVNTSAAYIWTGTQRFNNTGIFNATVNLNDVVNSKAGVNNFATTTARDAAIPAPVKGVTCYIQADDQLQFHDGVRWRVYSDNTLLSTKSSSFTLDFVDAGKTLECDSSSDIVITIPLASAVNFANGTRLDILRLGTGNVSISPDSGVELVSKNNNRKIAARYSGATCIKRGTNTWILIGDLTA